MPVKDHEGPLENKFPVENRLLPQGGPPLQPASPPAAVVAAGHAFCLALGCLGPPQSGLEVALVKRALHARATAALEGAARACQAPGEGAGCANASWAPAAHAAS